MMRWDFGIRNSDCGFIPRRQRCAPSFRNPQSAIRNALTLIELLITISIIATLAAMFLGASNAAMESARSARTKTTIAKIHSLLMERWDTYSTRRVELSDTVVNNINSSFPPGPLRGSAIADARLLALRELMKLEMPDRWSDIDMSQYPGTTGFFLRDIPSLARAYDRRLTQAVNVSDIGTVEKNGSAECLFLTVMLGTGDGEARTLFSRQDIGDTDGDGAMEFLDGWGRAIRWVRWPAGFVARSNLMNGDSDTEPDPFDPFRRNVLNASPTASSFTGPIRLYIEHLRGTDGPNREIGFRLIPLVFSMGPDGIGDISTRKGNITNNANAILLDPYAWDTTNNAYEFGSYGDNPEMPDGEDNSLDNIHNHAQEGR